MGWLRWLLAALGGAWVLARFALRARWRHWRAARAGRRLARQTSLESSPALDFAPNVHELDPVWLHGPQAGAQSGDTRGPVLVYFAGTGETLHAPLPALRDLLRACSELDGARCFVVEPPHNPGAYGRSTGFSARNWERLSPLVDTFEGPFVLLGLSRGAMAAMDAGARIAEERRKVAACVAFSPPLAVPPKLPPSVQLVAALEGFVRETVERFTEPPDHGTPQFLAATVRSVQVALTGFIQEELHMYTDEHLRWALHDVQRQDPLQTSLRSVREFGLLARADEHELTRLCDFVAGALSRNEGLVLSSVWGEQDEWARAEQCQAKLRRALSRAGVAEDLVQHNILPGYGHALFRQRGADLGRLAQWVDDAVRAGLERHAAREARRAQEEAFHMRLRSEPPEVN